VAVLLSACVSLALAAVRAGAAGRANDGAAQEPPVVGNYREASPSDPGVLAAARFAVRAERRRRGGRVTLLSVERAETQVVAGTNYRLRLRVNVAGRVRSVDAEVYENPQRRLSLTRWEYVRDVQQPGAREVKIFLVALDDNGRTGRRIGCGDSLVAVTRAVNASGDAVLRAALEELLSLPHDYDARLKNYWRGNNLRVAGVSLRNGLATIRITGEGPFVAGVCDAPRITEQIRATARQFPAVRRAAVFVNGRRLESALR
jgi:hypothetical protein